MTAKNLEIKVVTRTETCTKVTKTVTYPYSELIKLLGLPPGTGLSVCNMEIDDYGDPLVAVFETSDTKVEES